MPMFLNHPRNLKEANVVKVAQNEAGKIVPAVPTDFHKFIK